MGSGGSGQSKSETSSDFRDASLFQVRDAAFVRSGEYRTEGDAIKGGAFLCLGRLGVRTGSFLSCKADSKNLLWQEICPEKKGFLTAKSL